MCHESGLFVVREGSNEGEILEDEEARVEEETGDIGKETRVGETDALGAKSTGLPKGSSLVAGCSVANRPSESSPEVVGQTHGLVVMAGEGMEEFPDG